MLTAAMVFCALAVVFALVATRAAGRAAGSARSARRHMTEAWAAASRAQADRMALEAVARTLVGDWADSLPEVSERS